MSSPENAFELAPHQTFKRSLEHLGYIVRTNYFPALPEGHPSRYAAIVVPEEENTKKLGTLNRISRTYWEAESREAERDGRYIPELISIAELPWEILETDMRMHRSASAWDALAGSAETASRLADDAAPCHYIELSDTEFFAEADCSIYRLTNNTAAEDTFVIVDNSGLAGGQSALFFG